MMNTPSDFQPPAAPGMVNADQRPVDVVVLFSGGLDSILAAKVLEEQGLRVCCLHCHSPFFGDPGAVERWSNLYGLDIRTLDVSDDFCAMLRARPAHGFGKVMNPCVDCKILLLRHARLYMESIGARLLATGEVMGIGSTLEECLLKSVRSLEIGAQHLWLPKFQNMTKAELTEYLHQFRDDGLFAVAQLLRLGASVDEVAALTMITPYFLETIRGIALTGPRHPDFISVGRLTHSAVAADFSMTLANA